MKIPSKIRVGGQVLEVTIPKALDNGNLGKCCVGHGYIKIADSYDGEKQSESSKRNTFWHEVTHAILDTMGEQELSRNERFVCTFAGFLNEVVTSMEEDTKQPRKE